MQLSSILNTICWRDCPFPIVYSFLLCQKLIDHIVVGCLWVFYLVALIFVSIFILFSWLQLCSITWNLELGYFWLCFSFSVALANQGLLWFHTNLRIACSSSVKNAVGILIEIALNVYIALGSIDILALFVLPNYEYELPFISLISFINVP